MLLYFCKEHFSLVSSMYQYLVIKFPICLNIITYFCTRCGKFTHDNVYHAKIQDIQNVSSYRREKFESLATPSPCPPFSHFGIPLQDNNCGQRPEHQGPVVRKPGLSLNPGFFFSCSKAFSRIIFSAIFRASNHQLVDR